jgi:hypothetical protein
MSAAWVRSLCEAYTAMEALHKACVGLCWLVSRRGLEWWGLHQTWAG